MNRQVRQGDFCCTISQLLVVFGSVFCLSGIAQAGCKGGVGTDNIEISNKDPDFYESGDVVDCITTGSITLGPDITIPDGASFNLVAPRVSIETEVEALLGSQLRIFTGRKPLNDTGIVDCSNEDSNNLACPVATHPGQDAEYGRDADDTQNDDSDGHAGFSFSRVCNSGELAGEGDCPVVPDLGNGVSDWACTKDNVTGLTWEVKTNDGGLRDRDSTYTWYNPDSTINGGSAGTQDGGNCIGSDCDTHGYVQTVNTQGLCGANDWRMPTKHELRNIVSLDRHSPSIDTDYFSNTRSSGCWSNSPHANASSRAWYVYFSDGRSHHHYKSNFVHVRLVRGG